MVLFIIYSTPDGCGRWCGQETLTEQLFSGLVMDIIPPGPKPGSDRTIKLVWNLHFA